MNAFKFGACGPTAEAFQRFFGRHTGFGIPADCFEVVFNLGVHIDGHAFERADFY